MHRRAELLQPVGLSDKRTCLMSSYLKSGLLVLVLCTVALLLFVNVVERNTSTKANFVPDSFSTDIVPGTTKTVGKLLDLDGFEYVIRPSCNSTFLTWIVTSYAGDAAPRSALRRAYTARDLAGLGITRVFLLGQLDDAAQRKTGVVQTAVLNESERFRDIVQGNFYEAYRNLTYKHLMGLKWASDSCVNARYIMKQDDDIVINLYEIVERLRRFRGDERVFAGYVLRGMKPVREPANKWYVTEKEFRGDVYPDFLSGWLYLVGRELAAKLVQRSEDWANYFWIDDVFLTGVLRRELNFGLTDIHEMYTTDYRYLTCCIKGGEKRLKCEFAVGPNGGEVELQVGFRKFAEFCRTQCLPRPRGLSVGKTCVVQYERPGVQNGSARIEPIQFI